MKDYDKAALIAIAGCVGVVSCGIGLITVDSVPVPELVQEHLSLENKLNNTIKIQDVLDKPSILDKCEPIKIRYNELSEDPEYIEAKETYDSQRKQYVKKVLGWAGGLLASFIPIVYSAHKLYGIATGASKT